MESWKKIKNYESYEVSNLGNVRTFNKRNSINNYDEPKLLKQKQIITHCGKKYTRVNLCLNGTKKQYFVHRLVCECFKDNPENKQQVNHIDNNPLNNELSNLEWCTNSENQIHRFKINGTINKFGQYVHKNRTTYRVYKRGVIDKCFKQLSHAQEYAKQYY